MHAGLRISDVRLFCGVTVVLLATTERSAPTRSAVPLTGGHVAPRQRDVQHGSQYLLRLPAGAESKVSAVCQWHGRAACVAWEFILYIILYIGYIRLPWCSLYARTKPTLPAVIEGSTPYFSSHILVNGYFKDILNTFII